MEKHKPTLLWTESPDPGPSAGVFITAIVGIVMLVAGFAVLVFRSLQCP